METLLLDPEDHFYGGGEKFTRLDHVGRTIRMWQRNPYGARTELAYKNIPLLVGTRGYGLFVDVPTAVTFHLGSLSNRSYTIHAAGPELDYYLLVGTPKEIVAAYTDLTGKPAVPPEWAFGLWASSGFVQATEASVREQTARLRKEGIPCDVFHFDCFWQKPLMWCDFEWDAARFPDPPRLLKELHASGIPQLPLGEPVRLGPERHVSGGGGQGLLPAAPRRQRLRGAPMEPALGARHGALRHRRPHQSRGGGLVPGEARDAARARR